MYSNHRTTVKICGMNTLEDTQVACAAGVDAIGLIFYEKSARNVSLEMAKNIVAELPPFVTSVGVFLNPEKTLVEDVLAQLPMDLLQFHGTETPAFCESFNHPYIKAIGMKNIADESAFTAIATPYTNARAFLVDSNAAGSAGGTGKTFNWKNIPQNQQKPIILAGGLSPDNVAAAIEQANIYGVDLISGVESQPGKKDHEKIKQLMTEVRRVQCN